MGACASAIWLVTGRARALLTATGGGGGLSLTTGDRSDDGGARASREA